LSANKLNSEFAHHGIILEALNRDLHRFWEIEEVSPRSLEKQCEEYFRATQSRISERRYIVRLSFKNGPPISLSDSCSAAIWSFYRMEQHLKRDSINSTEYGDFLAEYGITSYNQKSPDRHY